MTVENAVYNKRNIDNAKNQVKKMLEEMKNAKYHWENYTKQGIEDWERQRK